jgi:hypothetical protein
LNVYWITSQIFLISAFPGSAWKCQPEALPPLFIKSSTAQSAEALADLEERVRSSKTRFETQKPDFEFVNLVLKPQNLILNS